VAVPINAAKAETLAFPPGVAPQQFDESDNCAKVERRFIAFSLLKIQEYLKFTPTSHKERPKKPKFSLGFSDFNHQFSSLRWSDRAHKDTAIPVIAEMTITS
jgi:hypothetical protein